MNKNSGISEIIGAIILIGIFAGVVGIIAVEMTSNSQKEKIPDAVFDIQNESQTIKIYQKGGDSIPGAIPGNTLDAFNGSKYRIIVTDSNNISYESPGITSFSNQSGVRFSDLKGGEVLKSSGSFMGSAMPSKVDIIYRMNDGNEVLIYSKNLEPIAGKTYIPPTIVPPLPVITGSVNGKVTRDGLPLSGITIMLDVPSWSIRSTMQSRSDGTYSFSGIPDATEFSVSEDISTLPAGTYPTSPVIYNYFSLPSSSIPTFTHHQSKITVRLLNTIDGSDACSGSIKMGTLKLNGNQVGCTDTKLVNTSNPLIYSWFPNSPCYQVDHMIMDGTSLPSSTSSETFSPPYDQDHSLDIYLKLLQNTVIADSTSGGHIIPNGTMIINCGASLNFTSYPDVCNGLTLTDNNITVPSNPLVYSLSNITSYHAIHAAFTPRKYAINASVSPAGKGSINYPGNYQWDCKSQPQYSFLNTSCTQLTDLKVNGNSVFQNIIFNGTYGYYTFPPIQNDINNFMAYYSIKKDQVVVTVGNGGSVIPNSTVQVDCGTDQQFTATPAVGTFGPNQVYQVFADGVYVGSDMPYTFSNIVSNHTLKVTFAIKGVQGRYWNNAKLYGDYNNRDFNLTVVNMNDANPAQRTPIESRNPTNTQIHNYLTLTDKNGRDAFSYPSLDNNWPCGVPLSGTKLCNDNTNLDNFYVNWTGLIRLTQATTITFYTIADDGIKLYIDGNLITTDDRSWQKPYPPDKAVEYPYPVSLTKGYHTFTLKYYDNGDKGTGQFNYTPNGTLPSVPFDKYYYPA